VARRSKTSSDRQRGAHRGAESLMARPRIKRPQAEIWDYSLGLFHIVTVLQPKFSSIIRSSSSTLSRKGLRSQSAPICPQPSSPAERAGQAHEQKRGVHRGGPRRGPAQTSSCRSQISSVIDQLRPSSLWDLRKTHSAKQKMMVPRPRPTRWPGGLAARGCLSRHRRQAGSRGQGEPTQADGVGR
jgi:hypothetical protein